MYFMWFGAPILCFQILLVQKQWIWRWLDLPWWALSIPKWEGPFNWFRLCQAFEDSWAGNRGNSEFGIRMGEVVPWYLQPFYIHFWHQIWGETICEMSTVPWSHSQRQASSALDAFLFRRAAHAATGSSAAMLAKELYVVPRVVRAAAKCARPFCLKSAPVLWGQTAKMLRKFEVKGFHHPKW